MISSKFICGLLLVVLSGGCSDAAVNIVQKSSVKKSWHEKFNWKAEDYFEDPQVIELCKAIEANDLVEMQRLIDAGVDVNTLGKGNMTLLLWAFPDGKFERFKLLMKSGSDPNIYFESNFRVVPLLKVGQTITHVACELPSPYFDCVFQHDGDPNLINKVLTLNIKETPLFTVLRRGTNLEKRIKTLLDLGVDINQREPVEAGGATAIMTAAHRGHYDVCLFMLDNGADPFACSSSSSSRLIHVLARRENEILKWSKAEEIEKYNKLIIRLEKEYGESFAEVKNNQQQRRIYIDNGGTTEGWTKQELAMRRREHKKQQEELKRERTKKRQAIRHSDDLLGLIPTSEYPVSEQVRDLTEQEKAAIDLNDTADSQIVLSIADHFAKEINNPEAGTFKRTWLEVMANRKIRYIPNPRRNEQVLEASLTSDEMTWLLNLVVNELKAKERNTDEIRKRCSQVSLQSFRAIEETEFHLYLPNCKHSFIIPMKALLDRTLREQLELYPLVSIFDYATHLVMRKHFKSIPKHLELLEALNGRLKEMHPAAPPFVLDHILEVSRLPDMHLIVLLENIYFEPDGTCYGISGSIVKKDQQSPPMFKVVKSTIPNRKRKPVAQSPKE